MLTVQEWNALSEDEQRTREAEMPEEVRVELNKAERERLLNSNIEKDRKLKAATQQAEELNRRITELERTGAPTAEITELERVRKQYEIDLEKDPMMANGRLASYLASKAIGDFRKVEQVKRASLRKLRKDYPRDMDKYGEELEEMLDNVTDPLKISADSVLIVFNSLRGKSVDDQIKEAEERGAKKAREDAGIVAIDHGGSSGAGGGGKTSLTKDQQDECERMGLIEKEYKELLRGRQEKDKLEGVTPRSLIAPKH